MHRLTAHSILIAATAILTAAAAAIMPGDGSPTPLIAQSFMTAYSRGGFAAQTSAVFDTVRPLVVPALIQLFTSKADGTNTYALIMPDQTANTLVTWQVYEDIYNSYSSLGAGTVGVPTMDTMACPITSFGLCDYQLFTKDYALFAYSSPAGLNLSVKDPYFTIWSAAGGIAGSFGPVISAQTAATSAISGVAGTQQAFTTGVIFSYPNSATTSGVYGLSGPFYSLYTSSNGTNTLGFPTSAAAVINTTTGLVQQTFEGGKIQQLPASDPTVIYPLGQINILNANQGLSLAPGATATISALTLDSQQNIVTGRVLNWSTSNGAVATVQGSGYTAIVTGVAAGAASIYATGEGKTSPALIVSVGAGCCAIGQGAPTQAIANSFEAAAMRNALPAGITATGTVIRAGPGYIQVLDASGTTYVIAQADGSGTAYVISGPFYAAYLANGGFAGALGYPVSDLLAGNAQKFANGAALAGIPALVIPAAIAPKWFQNQTAAGAPSASAMAFASYTGTSGVSQAFAGGDIFATAGQAFFSTGAVLARYMVLLGPAGALGAPISDVYSNQGVPTENFEGGYIDQQPGAATAVEHFNPRHPSLSLVPPAVAPGGRVHISATGFAPGANMAFTVTGQANFNFQSAAGAFSWDVVVPATAKPATVAIQVNDTGSKDTASGSYSIVQPAALLPTLTVASGDLQTGYPSSVLPLAVVAVLLDSSGNPLPNVPITLSVSPGASATGPAVTDSQGRAVVSMRLPPQPGVATGSIAAGGQVATFSALASPGSLAAFPALAASGQPTTLLASMASAILYYQNGGVLPASGGAANTAALAQYLTAQNGFAVSDTGDSILNPWVAARFASGALNVEPTALDHVRDLVAAGVPAILNLSLTIDGKPAGGASVNAVGVASDGSILIADPNPATAQTVLTAYLSGFQAQGHSYRGGVSSVLSISAAQFAAGAAPFTVSSPLTGGAAVASAGASCSSVDLAGAIAPGGVRFQYCDGTASLYELDFATQTGAALLDLAGLDLAGGPSLQIQASTGARWSIARKNGALTAVLATLAITGVTDSAAFAPALAPNQLFTIFGTGFTTSGLTVTLGGKAAQTLSVSPFQINALVPASTAAGANAALVVSSGGSTVNTSVAIGATAPGIFMVGSLGAILNSDATLNSPSNPAQRGQYVSVYCTGLGATTTSGLLQPVVTAVSVTINGQAVKPLYAGAVTGFVGLYQVNVTIPGALPPGLAGTLMLTQGKSTSNTAPLAVD